MKENMKGFFSGMPKRDGVERIGFMLLFPVGIALCLLKLGLVNGVEIGIPEFDVLEKNELWFSVVKCWNNNSPVFRGMSSGFMKIDLLGVLVSLIISVLSVRSNSLKVWGGALSLQVLALSFLVFMGLILSDLIALAGCGDIEKDSVNLVAYLMKNTTLGLLLKTYVVMASGYYLPSSVRMLVNKITIEFS